MKLSQFKKHLDQSSSQDLRFALPDGDFIEAHAHITEVGRIDKSFIDCGGTVRKLSYCLLQAWVADDTDHRLFPGRLASIIEKASPILGEEDLEVEIEYEDCQISQFPVESADHSEGTLVFRLSNKHTDCLAKDLCLPKGTAQQCEVGSGCC